MMMKITKLFCLCSFLLLFQTTETKASHMVGGQITWECLPNGQYIFYMEVYRECTGVLFHYGRQRIDYQNGSFFVKPDSNRWLTYGGNGNISAIGLSGCQRQCSNSYNGPNQLGATQIFPYKSDTISLTGIPPIGGWLFEWVQCCRPSSVANLSSPTSDNFTLRARMFPYKGKNANQCYDSSPKFNELPAVLFCKGNEYIYNHNPVDEDLDSLVFSWAEPWHQTNTPVVFASGYSYNNPLPDTSVHPLNIPASLSSQSGEIHFRTYSGQSGMQYATTVRVDSYREGNLIASVFRDIPFIGFDCPPNNPPTASFNGIQAKGFVDTVTVGEKISIPIQLMDTDIDSASMLPQEIAIAPRGYLFSNNFSDSLDCKDSTLAPCATVSPTPLFDSIAGEFLLKDQGTLNAVFEWQTDCVHLGADTGKISNYKTYNFIVKSYDAACDVPGTIYPSISIVVERFLPNIQQNGNILSVDTADSYQWYFNGSPIPNSDTNRIIMSSNGNYSVQLVKNGCYSQKAHRLLNVSLDEHGWTEQIKVYPNPFKDGFVVEVPDILNEEPTIEIMDLNGKSIPVNTVLNNNKINIHSTDQLSPGVYFLRLKSGAQEMYQKVVKY